MIDQELTTITECKLKQMQTTVRDFMKKTWENRNKSKSKNYKGGCDENCKT